MYPLFRGGTEALRPCDGRLLPPRPLAPLLGGIFASFGAVPCGVLPLAFGEFLAAFGADIRPII